SSSAGATWLPDCNASLRREYWRVYATSEGHAFMLPRPDGASQLAAPCHAAQHPLGAIVQTYQPCSSATSTAQVDVINDMNVNDAFAVARYLNAQLVFITTPSDLGLFPFPIPSDIIDACALHPSMNSAELTTICNRESDRLRSGLDIGFTYMGPGA